MLDWYLGQCIMVLKIDVDKDIKESNYTTSQTFTFDWIYKWVQIEYSVARE